MQHQIDACNSLAYGNHIGSDIFRIFATRYQRHLATISGLINTPTNKRFLGSTACLHNNLVLSLARSNGSRLPTVGVFEVAKLIANARQHPRGPNPRYNALLVACRPKLGSRAGRLVVSGHVDRQKKKRSLCCLSHKHDKTRYNNL